MAGKKSGWQKASCANLCTAESQLFDNETIAMSEEYYTFAAAINTKDYDNEEDLHHTTDAPRAHAHDGTGTGMARQLRRRDATSILMG